LKELMGIKRDQREQGVGSCGECAFIDRGKDRRMTEAKNRQIILVSRPYGEPKPENFKLAEAPIPAIGPGQVLSR